MSASDACAVVTLTSGRQIMVPGLGRDELSTSLARALSAQVPLAVLSGDDYMVSINPFAVETIEDRRGAA